MRTWTPAAASTGRKIRTRPVRFGATTALVITDDPDLQAFGRDVIDRLALTGPLKIDVKRDPQGAIWLLEVNARFTLWAHPGALAGVNLTAVAYADLTGTPPPVVAPRPGVRWCDPLQDLAAARE